MRILPDERATGLSPADPASLDARSAQARGPDAVGVALRAYGEELAALGAAQTDGAFTDDPAADAFIKSDPAAFLIGVLFTQGIPAERAWAGPYLLAQRLGYFDLERVAVEHDAVAAAIGTPPALHRFVHTLPGWIVAAARRIVTEYAGDATTIWSAGTPLPIVVERLRAFAGIGPKKAAMAVEILVRHFGAQLTDVECGSVAYDVHVRRVFLRSGLVDEDTPAAVLAAARRACPQTPGVLDLATWLIGRDYCHPHKPRCDDCRLGAVCERLTGRSVSGVGSRRVT